MYNGIKRKRKHKFTIEFPTKFQMLTNEETIVNGIIQQQLKIKTIDLKADPNIKWQDFEISNLRAGGVNLDSLKTVTMTPSKEKIASNAETANTVLEMYEVINEIEKEKTE